MRRLDEYIRVLFGSVDMEAYVAYENIRFHGKHAGVDAAHLYGAVRGKLLEVCEEYELPYRGIAPNTARKLAFGNGRMTKVQVKRACEELFKRKIKASKSYDNTDAIAVAVAFAKEMGWA
jgi:Holliday junction resolvasome RuvABC endonuclease subunit